MSDDGLEPTTEDQEKQLQEIATVLHGLAAIPTSPKMKARVTTAAETAESLLRKVRDRGIEARDAFSTDVAAEWKSVVADVLRKALAPKAGKDGR